MHGDPPEKERGQRWLKMGEGRRLRRDGTWPFPFPRWLDLPKEEMGERGEGGERRKMGGSNVGPSGGKVYIISFFCQGSK